MAQWLDQINISEDKLIDKRIKTAGYFTGDVGTVNSSSFVTASLSTGNKEYYYNLQYSSEDQLGIAYGHYDGSGSSDEAGYGQTKAIYGQFANILLDTDEVDIGFCLTSSAYHTVDNRVKDVYFIVAERARMKDRLNKQYWTVMLSGSTHTAGTSGATGSGKFYFTDNSATGAGEKTRAGVRYNIVSGSNGVPYTADTKIYGHFYPAVGVMAFNGTHLSSSMPGGRAFKENTTPLKLSAGSFSAGTAVFDATGSGLAPDTTSDADNAGKLARAIIEGGSITLRSEEDFLQVSYLCRIKAGDFNFTNNPTFTSGSTNDWTQPSFKGDPHTIVSTIGLFDGNRKLVAVGRFSKPLVKNRYTEFLTKVRLTY